MKQYVSPSFDIISLETYESISYTNPLETAVVTTSSGKIITTYNMLLLDPGSQI